MFATYLRRELGNRTRQTVIVAIGMALAIALVIVVSAISAGVKNAQAQVLESIYGVGTDITVTYPAAAPGEGGGPVQFDFDSGAGTTDEDAGTTTLSQTRLTTDLGTTTFDASTLDTITGIDGVAAATATLSLQNLTFSGEMPDPSQFVGGGPIGGGAQSPDSGGSDGAGGSAFDIDRFSVEGVDVEASSVGPLTAVEVTDGRALEASDLGTNVAVLDSAYAATAELAVGDTLAIGGTDFEIVGLVASTSSEATTIGDVYIPLDVAQALAGLDGLVTTVYVQAADASQVSDLAAAISAEIPDATVSTQEDLASSVSGSLSTASDLVGNLGTWLSVIVLAAAFVLAILFTISGVTRRTREFGTLKAIGWSNGRIVRQVAGESLVQGLIGGAAGIALGLAGIWVVNLVAPTLTASTSNFSFGPGGGPQLVAGDTTTGAAGGPALAGGPMGGADAASTTDIVLTAPIAVSVLLLAVGLAILGGLLAGAIGGWRAARLRPAEALRSVA
jgi:ABC-type antimicrobial peptide transport system permease subunit